MTANDEVPPDYGLVSPLSIPEGSKVPHPKTGVSGPEEYDLYFRIVRDNGGLVAWSQSCLRIGGALLDDLRHAELSAEDKCRILEGLVSVQRVTLERWVALGEAAGEHAPAEEGGSG